MRLSRNVTFLFFLALCLHQAVSGAAHADISSVKLGINGQCKLGYYVPARIVFDGKLPEQITVAISLPDTDGILARFVDESPSVTLDDQKTVIETNVKLGRSKGMVEIQIFEGLRQASELDAAEPLAKSLFRVESVCTPQDALLEFYVSVGKSIEIKGATTLGARNDYAPAISAALESIGGLGRKLNSLDSLDGLFIEAGSFVEDPIPDETQTAIIHWVRQGGRLAVTGGEKLKEFFDKNEILAGIFDVQILGARRISTTNAMERIVKAGSPVSGQRDRPTIAISSEIAGDVILKEGEDPVVIRQRVGFGRVVLVTVNLAESPIADWSDRKSFCGYIFSLLDFETDARRNREKRVSRYGYQDISGQLRTALDSFTGVSTVNFTVVAAIAILFICLIGPADYFFLKKVIKRMEWTWLTFLLIVLGIGGLTYWIHSSAKASQLLCRQVEVIDIDTNDGTARGSVWAHVYSPTSQRYDIDWKLAGGMNRESQSGSWLGFPGEALGGMNNNSAISNTTSQYSIGVGSSLISQIPVNIAATKGVQLDWSGNAETSKVGSLSVSRNRLSGRVSNPLQVDLTNVFVIYDNDVYQFKTRLKPGDSFDVREDTSDRSLADYLNQRKVKDLGTEATAWRITDTNLRRILEIMMFYESAGGRGYVNLFQRYQSDIDLSHVDQKKNAILVGRSAKPANRMVVDGKELNEEYEESWTYYRILIPVQKSVGN